MSEIEDSRITDLRSAFEHVLSVQLDQFEREGMSRSKAIEEAITIFRNMYLTDENRFKLFSYPPGFDGHGYLLAMHRCDTVELQHRFGQKNQWRKDIMEEFSRVFDLCKQVSVKKIMIGGSFITNKEFPGDVDVAILVNENFNQVARDHPNSLQYKLKALSRLEKSTVHLIIE